MTTKNQTETLEHLSKAEREAAEAAQQAQATAEAARLKAEQARARADAERRKRAQQYTEQRQAAYSEERTAALATIAEKREAFEQAVVKGEPFGPVYLELIEAQAQLHALEREQAERLYATNRAPLYDPQPPTADLGAALSEVLRGEAERRTQAALEAIADKRRRFLDGDGDDAGFA